MSKPVVYYTETNPIIVGEPAYINAHNHPSNPTVDNWHARTSTVQNYDLTTGEFETYNTIYKVKVKAKSVLKTDHNITQASLQQDPHLRTVPLGTCQIAKRSDTIKHDLTELGYTFKYITCDKCDINAVCLYSFDIYNTDGDCLLK